MAREVDYRRVATQLVNRHKLAILEALRDGPASPVALSRRLEVPLANVSYHCTTLETAGLIRLLETRPRRGALEHVFELVDDVVLADDEQEVTDQP